MMNNTMKRIMSVLCAATAAIICLVMVFFEVINKDIPALLWLVLSMSMFANAAMIHMNNKRTV